MNDLEGTYSGISNGVSMSLRIYGADPNTASAVLSSTNAGTSSCAALILGDIVLLVFTDLSELQLRINGTSSLSFIDSGVTLRRQ